MKALYDKVSIKCSRLATRSYSTSFSLGISCLDKRLRDPIYSVYGFVRFADEIVDTFHDYDKEELLGRFKNDTYLAIQEKISLNPILNSFQHTVHRYQIDPMLIEQFLYSMEMDLSKTQYDQSAYEKYIVGSAEVVGLICLKVFCEGDVNKYCKLKPFAQKLGAAFQKVNFLRDMKTDYIEMGRTYFPGLKLLEFNEKNKKEIEEDIERDFEIGYKGIKKLPPCAKFGVYLAYVYYVALFKKIRKTSSTHVMKKRVRIPNPQKFSLLFSTYIKHRLNLL